MQCPKNAPRSAQCQGLRGNGDGYCVMLVVVVMVVVVVVMVMVVMVVRQRVYPDGQHYTHQSE